jgi:hypothetical protein
MSKGQQSGTLYEFYTPRPSPRHRFYTWSATRRRALGSSPAAPAGTGTSLGSGFASPWACFCATLRRAAPASPPGLTLRSARTSSRPPPAHPRWRAPGHGHGPECPPARRCRRQIEPERRFSLHLAIQLYLQSPDCFRCSQAHRQSPHLVRFDNTPEVRALSSTGITLLQRYCDPVRLPHEPTPGGTVEAATLVQHTGIAGSYFDVDDRRSPRFLGSVRTVIIDELPGPPWL